MKDKALKILSKVINVILEVLLIISSLPFICVLIEAIKYMFLGVSPNFFGDQTPIYGFDAFLFSIVARMLWLFQLGILPICIAYQLFYLIRYIVKNNKIDKFLNIIYIIILILSFFSYGPILLVCIAYQIFYLIRYKVKKDIVKKDMVFDIIYILSLIVSNYVGGIFFKISKAYQIFYITRYLVKKKKSKELKNIEKMI